ncbi:MAG: hypothetical protein ABH828_02710 [archaeon]
MDEVGEGMEMRVIEKIPDIMFLTLVFLAVAGITAFFVVSKMDTHQAEIDIFFNRLMYSSNAITYVDPETNRVHFGVLDISKLTSENIEKAISFPDKRVFAANITLQANEPINVYYHKDWFENYAPLARAGLDGAGGVDYIVKEFYVSYIKNAVIDVGLLRIEIVRPRS